MDRMAALSTLADRGEGEEEVQFSRKASKCARTECACACAVEVRAWGLWALDTRALTKTKKRNEAVPDFVQTIHERLNDLHAHVVELV